MDAYSIYDKKTGQYGNPIFVPNLTTALRSLSSALRERNNISDYPADFALYNVGRFEPDGGLMISNTNPVFVEEVSNLVQRKTVES